MAELADLEHRLGHVFSDPELLYRALCHRSWVAEHPDDLSNERLEFLGDAVLGWVTADLAFRRDADYAEGTLTDLRKAVVNARALAGVARDLHLGEHIWLGRGEAAAGGADKSCRLTVHGTHMRNPPGNDMYSSTTKNLVLSKQSPDARAATATFAMPRALNLQKLPVTTMGGLVAIQDPIRKFLPDGLSRSP